MNRVDGKIAIVTGAAAGIGRVTAEVLARAGAVVVLADINAEVGHALMTHMGGQAEFIVHDVRSDESWQSLINTVIRHHGRIDIIVNNAGITGSEAAEDIETVTLETWRAVHATNVEGVILGCKWGVLAMKNSGGGSIINISSMASMVGTPSLPAYGASKAAVRQITQTVALHCGRQSYSIRCNSLHPGFIDTEMVNTAFSAEKRNELLKSIPLGEFGTAEDVARAVLYLASDASRYLTGTQLVVDGGVTMR